MVILCPHSDLECNNRFFATHHYLPNLGSMIYWHDLSPENVFNPIILSSSVKITWEIPNPS